MNVTIITPRISETNFVGHVSNTAIPVWFEAGRDEFYRLFNPDPLNRKHRVALVHMSNDFLREMFYGQEVEIRTFVHAIGNSSVTLRQEAYQRGELCVTGCVVYVHLNFLEQRPESIPQEIRAKLAEYLRNNQ